MKYVSCLFICAMSLLPIPTLAHGDAEELGHHWQSHAYIGEIRYQLAMMAIMFVIIIAGSALLRARRHGGTS